MNCTKYYSGHIMKKIIEEPVILTPVGHHELSRHLVYRIDGQNKKPEIFKMFFVKNRWNREIATLKLLAESQVKIPRIISYGVLENKTEWLITECFEGMPLDTVIRNIQNENLRSIYMDIGRELGKMHSYQTFEFFGNWDEHGNSIDKNSDFKSVFIRRVKTVLDQLFDQKLPEESLQREAAKLLWDKVPLLEGISVSRLCHNDYNLRNIMVKNVDGFWSLEGIIDFEQSFPWDKDIDLVYLYHKLTKEDVKLRDDFMRGYEEYCQIGDDFYKKIDFYLLYMGLYICSWSYNPAPEYYRQGVNLLSSLV